jgi:hypothetical protein
MIVLGKRKAADIIDVDEDESGDNDREEVDEFGLLLVTRKVSALFTLCAVPF